MDGHTSPARFLAYLLAEHDVSVSQLCERSGLDSDIVRAFLAGRLPVTQTLADQLGVVFHSPGFWLTRQAQWGRTNAGDRPDGDGAKLC